MGMDAAATLTVRRTAEDDMQERELYVSVDGGPNRILRFGDSMTLRLEPGRHRVRVHNTISRRRVEFEAAASEHVRFQTSNVRGKGFGLWAMFFGIAPMHTELRREE